MFTDHGIVPMFSMALSRDGGLMATGGLPPVLYDPDSWVSSPILKTLHMVSSSYGSRTELEYLYYTIAINGWSYPGSERQSSGESRETAIVDSVSQISAPISGYSDSTRTR